VTAVDAAICFDGDGTISVSAAPEALAALGKALANEVESVVELTPPASTPPDCERATGVRVRRHAGPGVSVTREGSEVVIVGDAAAVAQLARNIERLGNEPATLGGHIHLEYFPDHAYLRPDSIPIVVIAT
jgi:hypothetical protein